MDSKLDYDIFYIFNAEYDNESLAVAPINYKDISFEEKSRFYLGDFSKTKPEYFIQVSGKKICDIVIAGAPSFNLFSDRIIVALRQNEVTGWGSFPVVIRTDSMQELNNYHVFYITGKAEKADINLSEKTEILLPNKTRKIRDKGYFFPLDSWEGTDVFYHVGTLGFITVTENIKNIFESLKVTNVHFEKCTEFIWP